MHKLLTIYSDTIFLKILDTAAWEFCRTGFLKLCVCLKYVLLSLTINFKESKEIIKQNNACIRRVCLCFKIEKKSFFSLITYPYNRASKIIMETYPYPHGKHVVRHVSFYWHRKRKIDYRVRIRVCMYVLCLCSIDR